MSRPRNRKEKVQLRNSPSQCRQSPLPTLHPYSHRPPWMHSFFSGNLNSFLENMSGHAQSIPCRWSPARQRQWEHVRVADGYPEKPGLQLQRWGSVTYGPASSLTKAS